MYCWGANTSGQLGDGTRTDRLTPVRVVGELAFSAVTTGAGHTCGLTPQGQAYCWGANGYGKLGTGTTADSPVPVSVSGGLTFALLSAGANHTCGVTPDGDLYCWGSHSGGELGTGAVPDDCPSPAVGAFACSLVPFRVPRPEA